MAGTADFTYDGAATVAAVCAGLDPSTAYDLVCLDPDSTMATGTSDSSGTLTLTVSDVGGLTAGDTFVAYVVLDSANTFVACIVLEYGTAEDPATDHGIAVTWTWDGTVGPTGTVTATFVTENAVDYTLSAPGHSLTGSDITGDGSSMTITKTTNLTNPDFLVRLCRTDFTKDYAATLFVTDTADSMFTGLTPHGGGAGLADPEGFCVAFDNATLDEAPAWTRIDTLTHVASYTIDRGRQYELDRTDTGTATVIVRDVDGTLDPTNPDGPYYGKLEPLLQAALALWDPCAETWTTIFRGFIETYSYEPDPSGVVNVLTVSLVDGFEILSNVEMAPGTAGDTPPAESTGDVFFDSANVHDRIIQALGNAGWPSGLTDVFSGNVSVVEASYSPGESILTVIQDCADAEFPGVSNFFMSKVNWATFRGRWAKFHPDLVAAEPGVTWAFTRWKCGDGAAVAASPSDTAHIRAMTYDRGLARIINSALATYKGIKDSDIEAQLSTDATSIAQYGVRSWSAENLLTGGGLATNIGDPAAETKLFSDYYKDNGAQPRNRIGQLVFKAMRPTDPRAAANWALLAGVEIGDAVDPTISFPGGGGFSGEEFFVEGIHYEVEPAPPPIFNFPTLTLDVSPAAYYGTFGNDPFVS